VNELLETFVPSRCPISSDRFEFQHQGKVRVCLPRASSLNLSFWNSRSSLGTTCRSPTMSLSNNGRHLIGKLTPENTVFLLCDIQNRFRPLTWKGETVINTARYMTSVAKALNIPVIITQQYTKVFGDTVKDCFADPTDIEKYPIVDKKRFSMCVSEVNNELEKLNRKSVVLFGIEAHVCVQQTCLDLLAKGDEVHLILDGISSQQPYVSPR